MDKKCVVILNPIAGKGYGEKRLPQIRNFLEKNNFEYEIILTRHPGHGIALARDYGHDRHNIVFASGGDGTCNEVINGLMEVRKGHPLCFGVLPTGRGNDFSYGIGVAADLGKALQDISENSTRTIDIGLVKGGYFPNGRYFGNGIGVGFDTIVGLEAAKMKHVHGAAAYALGAIKTFFLYPEPPCALLEFNGEKQEMAPIQISIMNGRRMGGAFFMAPQAETNDGLFDICISKQVSRRQLVRTILSYTKGTQASLPNIITDRTKKMKITAMKGGLTVHADGETVCIDGRSLEISCVPNALTLVNGSPGT
ncbi:MAG: diacylglycerol kinase family lipid kinase [Spirochaetales bacterium]|nr:diacylglycerol kinase family lipid kinase [Spirochaetales bacterium]